jgi:hypothetical protein
VVAKGAEAVSRKPEKMRVDKGKEFYNKDVKVLGVELYRIEYEESCIFERWKYSYEGMLTANNTYRYIYNN